MPSPTKSRIALALGSLLLTLGILEISGRVFVSEPVERHDGFAYDSQLGWRLPAGQTMSWRGQSAIINRIGLRSPELKSAATTTILTIGDSSVFGDGVRDHETLAAQISGLLGPGVDVQNAGVPGYTCWQSRLWVERIRKQFQPDILISYNQHSDYRRASGHDRVIAATQLGPVAKLGIGRLISYASLHWRIRQGGSNLTVDEYGDCLSGLAKDQESAGGSMVFVVPITDVDFESSPLFGQPEPGEPGTRLIDYRTVMRDVASARGAVLVNGKDAITAARLTGNQALLDTVHPTAKGHSALSKGIVGAITDAGLLGSAPQKR